MSDQPIFETTLQETLGIRKFLEMSMADLREQLARAALDPRVPKKVFTAQKRTAEILTAWMVSALATVDAMLADAAAKTKTSLAEELNNAA